MGYGDLVEVGPFRLKGPAEAGGFCAVMSAGAGRTSISTGK
jgi:hypothetical protein